MYDGILYMAWKGIQGDEGIYWTTFDGSNWAPQQKVGGVGTSVGPALAPGFDRLLYMAWKGIVGDEGIYWSTFNGTNWI